MPQVTNPCCKKGFSDAIFLSFSIKIIESMANIGFGIFCSNGDNTITTNHTFRLKNLSWEVVLQTFLRNLEDLFKLLDLCREEKIEVFRLGSNFVPYASHKDFKRRWLYDLEPYLTGIKERLREYKIRITMHPGQFVVLNSERKEVVENSLKELEYHFWLLDSLGVGEEGLVIVHVGAGGKNKEHAISNFVKTFERNSWLKRRLALENDEKTFTASDVLGLARELGVPFVFDFFHHKLNPSEFDPSLLIDTWGDKNGPPKFHLSSGDKRRKGVHAEYLMIEDYLEFVDFLKLLGLERVHVMLEVKKKEKALRRLRLDLERLKEKGPF